MPKQSKLELRRFDAPFPRTEQESWLESPVFAETPMAHARRRRGEPPTRNDCTNY